MSTQLYEIEGTGIELTEEQLLALVNLFNEPGWKVLMHVKSIEDAAAVECGMGLNTPEEQRTMNRAVHHKLLADVEFPLLVREALRQAQNKRT